MLYDIAYDGEARRSIISYVYDIVQDIVYIGQISLIVYDIVGNQESRCRRVVVGV